MKLVHGFPNLRKGTNGVIINVSDSERRSYRQAKQTALKQLHSQEEIQSLRTELDELKDLVKQLIQK